MTGPNKVIPVGVLDLSRAPGVMAAGPLLVTQQVEACPFHAPLGVVTTGAAGSALLKRSARAPRFRKDPGMVRDPQANQLSPLVVQTLEPSLATVVTRIVMHRLYNNKDK